MVWETEYYKSQKHLSKLSKLDLVKIEKEYFLNKSGVCVKSA